MTKENPKHQAVFELVDPEGEDGRDEEEIPRQGAERGGDEDRSLPDEEPEQDDRHEVKQRDGGVANPALDRQTRQGQAEDRQQGRHVLTRLRRRGDGPFPPPAAPAPRFGGHDIDVDLAAAANEPVARGTAAQEIQDGRPPRFADDDLADIVLLGDAHQCAGDIAIGHHNDLGV